MDVIANLGVILSGSLVVLIHSPIPYRIIGIAIGLYVIKEAIEILRHAEVSDDLLDGAHR